MGERKAEVAPGFSLSAGSCVTWASLQIRQEFWEDCESLFIMIMVMEVWYISYQDKSH